jgi:PAS domain S-box-containing protein
MQPNWCQETDVGITVCDVQGIILSMNERAAAIFAKSGGRELIGKSMMDCHPPQAQEKIRRLLKSQKPYCYTVEYRGVKTLLYQSPWKEYGKFMGFVEFILVLPEVMPQLDKIHWVKK